MTNLIEKTGKFGSALLTLALAGSILIQVTSVKATPATGQAELRIMKAQQALQRYGLTQSLDDLRTAVSLMSGTVDVDSLTPTNFIAKRRELVAAWIPILNALDHAYDRKFNAAERRVCPAPPMENGIQLRPCADASYVKDAQARAKYVASLSAFRAYVQRANRYRDLRNIDLWATLLFSKSLDMMRDLAPDGASADFTALDTILRRSGASSERRNQLDAMFYARAVP